MTTHATPLPTHHALHFPRIPKRSNAVANIIRAFRRRTEDTHQDLYHLSDPKALTILRRFTTTPDEHNGYIRIVGNLDLPFATHKVHAVLRIVEIDPETEDTPQTYHVVIVRNLSEEQAAQDPDRRTRWIDDISLEKARYELLHWAHVVESNGRISQEFILPRPLYLKALNTQPGHEFPYGTRRRRTRKLVTRLSETEQAHFLNRAGYLIETLFDSDMDEF